MQIRHHKSPKTHQHPGLRAHGVAPVAFFLLTMCVHSGLCFNKNLNAGTPQEPSEKIDFTTEVLPVLTKAGCNSGACHGAAAGRGEFRLSLFGSNPAADHFAIARHLNSRRVNLASPEKSLVILKPSGEVDHAGGIRFEASSPEAMQLRQWIRDGAEFGSDRKAVTLRSEPHSVIADSGRVTSIRYFAVLSDGTEVDVSDRVAVSNPDSDSLHVQLPDFTSGHHHSPESAGMQVTAKRAGRHLLTARFPGAIVATEILAPWPESSSAFAVDATSDIDRLQQKRLALMHLSPSPPVDDVQFIHRASLLVTGRRPVWNEVDLFLKNQLADKRSRLIDELIQSEDFVDYWSWQLGRQWRIEQAQTPEAAVAWHYWIRKCLQDDIGLFQMTATMVAANGSPVDNPPAAFSTISRDARLQAEYFSEAFLGVRLRCANCHDHPLDRWTQEDYHGLAAIFARVTRDPVVTDRPSGININPATGQPAIPRLLSGASLKATANGRQQLVTWIHDDGSHLIASHVVNFVWRQLMGRGLVEPSDDLRSTNPSVHPEVFEYLVSRFIQSEGRLRPLIREICLSEAFQRGPAIPGSSIDLQLGSAREPVRLAPEILLDQLIQSTESPGIKLDSARRTVHPESKADDFTAFKIQSGCSAGCLSERPQETLSLALELINGRIVNQRVASDSQIVKKLQELRGDPESLILHMYHWTLSRQPLKSEMDFWNQQLKSIELPSDERLAELLTDAVWTLVTSDEFQCAP